MKKIQFQCPKCSSNRLEEVMIGVVQYSEVTAVDKEGNVDYGKHNCDGGEAVTFQCLECGEQLVNEDGAGVSDGEMLVEWLKAHPIPKKVTK